MPALIATDPLLALDAVVFDTETTGLDPGQARLLQIGAVRLVAGHLDETTTFETKVNPGIAIPPASTAIHGLGDGDVAQAPGFPDAYADFQAYAGEAVLIGHNVGFDLAILAREGKLSGIVPASSRVLDTRLLGELCFPRLAGFTLDALASHLGLAVVGRHDALADARLTAQLFLALLPHLRERSIRTFGEAEAACRQLTRALEGYARAGWVEPVRPTVSEGALARIDAYPFRHRVKDIATLAPVTLPATTSLGAATERMAKQGISSVFVDFGTGETGIVTERDVIRQIGTAGPVALAKSLGEIATRPLLTVPAEAYIYRAIGRMERRHIRHLGVVDEAGHLVGALSARDLLRLRASDALALGDAIDTANTLADLARAWARLPGVVARLRVEGVTAAECAGIISREIGALTRRAALDAEKKLEAAGLGPPPARYATLVLGSAGRGESLLVPDQDNATIHAGTEQDDAWFLAHGEAMTALLHEIGIPLCKGGVMARNPAWNGHAETWSHRIRSWTETTTPDDLLAVDIFYDFRIVHGDAGLAATLASEARGRARESRAMVKLLAAQLDRWSPPFAMFGRLRTDEDGRLDLKKSGLFPVVAAARCLALSHGMPARNTAERLAALRAARIGADRDLSAMEQAQALFMECILDQQLADIAKGQPPSTRVDVAALNSERRDALKDALKALATVPAMTHDLMFSAPAG
ncbi:MAG: DNA polymerase III subunit epsilon [Methylobacterium sp.]|nr:MAG: DNA polymerase III subunit epsilon [Methylobacterium sp.]